MTRRRLISASLVGLSRKAGRVVNGGFIDDSHLPGHRLRERAPAGSPKRTVKVPVVIIGGGIAGLSAAWRLDKRGFHDFLLLEMNSEAGGNSRWGENEVSAYPWAAHYVPVPNRESVLVRELLEEFGVGRGGEWDERHLCFSPQERLFLHGRWQEGLEPELGVPARERAEFQRFRELMQEFRAGGEFTIPVSRGAKPSPLAEISAEAWMRERGFRSPYLHWYVDYACRDDYGAHSADTSAWAAIHYFASREHEQTGPLTWPEGNGWIVRRLLAKLGRYVRTGVPVRRIEQRPRDVRVVAADVEYVAGQVIYAAPSFVARYVMDGPVPPRLSYSPWVTATLTLDRLPREAGFPVAWDNVIYQSRSLGYVVATHQSLATRQERSVWTWYHALADEWPATGRELLLAKPWSFWRDYILEDLERAHPDIRDCVSRIDVLRLGHAMARPTPGTLLSEALAQWRRPFGRVRFANSDLTGLSIFEEAQYHGVRAADQILGAI